MFKGILFLVLSYSFAVSAQSLPREEALELIAQYERDNINPYELFFYRQTKYQHDDPLGDYSLIKTYPLIFKSVFWGGLNKTNFPKEYAALYKEAAHNKKYYDLYVDENDPNKHREDDGNYVHGKDYKHNPIRIAGFIKMLTQVVIEEYKNGYEVHYGEVQDWSPEVKKMLWKKYPFKMSKLLTALSAGVTSQYFVTGEETPLKEFILEQKDESVTPEMVFRESFRLCDGNIYLTLMTIENIFSQYWRDPNRRHRSLTHKVIPITQYKNGTGDKFGAWYHFWGTALYAYSKGVEKARVTVVMENLLSDLLKDAKRTEFQEAWINYSGAEVGANLARIIKKEKYFKHKLDPKYLALESYLRLRKK